MLAGHSIRPEQLARCNAHIASSGVHVAHQPQAETLTIGQLARVVAAATVRLLSRCDYQVIRVVIPELLQAGHTREVVPLDCQVAQ